MTTGAAVTFVGTSVIAVGALVGTTVSIVGDTDGVFVGADVGTARLHAP